MVVSSSWLLGHVQFEDKKCRPCHNNQYSLGSSLRKMIVDFLVAGPPNVRIPLEQALNLHSKGKWHS